MLPDTQRYSESRPDLFFAQTNWIKNNRDKENIVFVTHVGDLVQNRSKNPSEWKVADEAMAVLDGVVPYGVTIGNHDYDSDDGVQKGAATMYMEHFNPDKRFKGRPSYGGASPNGLNSYHLLSAAGVDFVMLFLEVDAPDDALAWASGVLDKYPTRAAIVSMHTYMRHKGKEGGRETQTRVSQGRQRRRRDLAEVHPLPPADLHGALRTRRQPRGIPSDLTERRRRHCPGDAGRLPGPRQRRRWLVAAHPASCPPNARSKCVPTHPYSTSSRRTPTASSQFPGCFGRSAAPPTAGHPSNGGRNALLQLRPTDYACPRSACGSARR